MVVFDKELAGSEQLPPIGGKAAGLALLQRHGLPVPPFFVVLSQEQLGDAELEAALRRLGPGPYAVRSSAMAEDGARCSFAGQLESRLGARDATEVRRALRVCRASGSSPRVAAYCAARGVEPGPVAVVVQRMVRGQASGVMFTRDPQSPEELHISAGLGLGEGVVQGVADCDSYWVDPRGQVRSEVAEKRRQVTLRDGQPQQADVPAAQRSEAVLHSTEVQQLAEWGRQLERLTGHPQDIEWTLALGDLFLLQTRPITAQVPWGRKLLWDNSNIVESYHGVTTPLTYSFAAQAYAIVYRLFCAVMGVSAATIQQNDEIFGRMIGLIRGRVYYNLNAWYRLLTLLPGFQYNRAFLEQMMGVAEVAEDEDAEAQASAWQRNFVQLPRLLRLLMGLCWRLLRSKRDIKRFKANFEQAIATWRGRDLKAMEPSELLAAYRDLERRLLWSWTPPIVNDFFTMIFHGVLRKQCAALCSGDERAGAELSNALLAGQGGLESTAPTIALLEQAARMRRSRKATALFTGPDSDEEVLQRALKNEVFHKWSERWMARFGDRCVDELKLETTPLRKRPQVLVSALRNYLRGRPLDPQRFGDAERARRQAAEKQARRDLSGWRRWLFIWVLQRTRSSVAERENLRFLRTRVFGLVRDIFRALGAKMAASGALDSLDDVFYLHIDELFGWVEGTAVSRDWAGLVALRRAEFQRYRETPGPPERFHTYGPVHRGNRFLGKAQPPAAEDGLLRGTACYPGRVEGPALVLDDPSQGARLDGQILVAARTDPGWVPLFPSISGLLVERGSPLSHSAVVARELGIPTVVGIRGLCAAVSPGQRLRMDGGAGTVRLLEEAGDGDA